MNRKNYLMVVLAAVVLTAAASASQDSEVSVEVEEGCQLSLYNFEQPGEGEPDPKYIVEGASDFFSGMFVNTGSDQLEANGSINLYEEMENGTLRERPTEGNLVNGEFRFNLTVDRTVVNETDVERTNVLDFISEFTADYEPGTYVGEAKANYTCGEEEYSVNKSRPFEIIDTEEDGEEDTGDDEEDDGETEDAEFELDIDAIIEALNETAEFDIDTNETEDGELDLDALIEQINETTDIESESNRTEETELDLDALIEELEDSAEIDTDFDDIEEAELDLDAVLDELEESGELDTDVDITEDAETVEGDADVPGQTPTPQPQPMPEPLLSVSLMPLNSTYDAPRGRFTELGFEVENVGEETLSDLELEPGFSEDMQWESQSVTIDSLEVDEAVNESVYVNPDEEVSPGMYQIPVYASTGDTDIDMQYVNVRVTEDIFTAALNIDEAPQNVRFEMGQNYTIPILIENMEAESIEEVEVELQNADNCGEYDTQVIDEMDPESTASVSMDFQATDEITECEATVIASSEDGNIAFAETEIDIVEEVGIVPPEFRVPIIASMWTIMLLAYAVLSKKYGLQSMTVKMPLIVLVVGEAFILIYLSSVYYDLMPPGLLPF